MNRLWIACSFFAAMMLASCTQEDSMDYNMNIGGKQFLFTFNEESYQAKAQSRAHGVSASAADTVTLGEDMQAEVSIDEEAETEEHGVETRAAGMSNGHYVIYTLQNGGRVPDGVFRGTIEEVGGVKRFKPDAGYTSMVRFEGSNYTFVCYNTDAVTDNGVHLSFGTGKNAVVGLATMASSTSAKHKLSFEMKHQTARVRVKLTAYTAALSNIDAELVSDNVQPQTQRITDLTTLASVTTSSGIMAQESKMEETSTKFAKKFPKAHEFYTDYVYFNPGVQANDLSLKFKSGTICGQDMTGK